MKTRSLLLAMALATLLPASGSADPAPRRIIADASDAGRVEVLAPQGEPNAFIIFLSDRDGLTPGRRTEAAQLVGRGAVRPADRGPASPSHSLAPAAIMAAA
jgi:type IV secretory pathway VirJ component